VLVVSKVLVEVWIDGVADCESFIAEVRWAVARSTIYATGDSITERDPAPESTVRRFIFLVRSQF